jgi:hypothetical protein
MFHESIIEQYEANFLNPGEKHFSLNVTTPLDQFGKGMN